MLALIFLALTCPGVSALVGPSPRAAVPTTKLSAAAVIDKITDALGGGADADDGAVSLADCPPTRWGARIPDVGALQAEKRAAPYAPFIREVRPPAGASPADEVAFLRENADEINASTKSHGCVALKGWKTLEDAEGFRAAYEALGLAPCRDPLDAVSARPMVDKKSAVYEAVNKESRANFFIGMHNEFVGTRAPRAAMFVCFKAADSGGEFMVADGRRVFRDLNPDLLKRLYAKQIRYSVMELPFFGFLDALPEPLRGPASASVKSAVSAAINAKVDFDVKMQWLDDSAYGETKTMQARAPVQPPVVLHPDSGEPTWFCNVHSHSSALRKKREATYGAEKFVDGASQINKSDMYYGDDTELSAADLDEMDALTKEHTTYLAMKPGDAVLLDNYQTMHGRNVFAGKRKHAVSWFA